MSGLTVESLLLVASVLAGGIWLWRHTRTVKRKHQEARQEEQVSVTEFVPPDTSVIAERPRKVPEEEASITGFVTSDTSAIAERPREVPEWNTPGAELGDASREQLRFLEWWTREFERGEAPDIQGNLTYVFVYLYEFVADYIRNHDLKRLVGVLERVLDAYGDHEAVNRHASAWLGNAYLHHHRFDEAWDVFRARDSSNGGIYQILWVRQNCSENTIDGRDFFRCIRATKEAPPHEALTSFGIEEFDLILERANAFLTAYHGVHEENWVAGFVNRFDTKNLTASDLATLKCECDESVNFDEWVAEYDEWRVRQETDPYLEPDSRFKEWFMLINSPPGHYQAGYIFEYVDAVPSIVQRVLVARARQIARSLENSVRVVMGIPKIGQGWVSETHLFSQIQEEFPHLTVVQHHSPSWLGRQHLDVYIVEGHVAVEYQGKQHSEPIEMWGGEEGLARQKERDEAKRVLCQQHGCSLIYVHPGYNFREVAQRISAVLGCAPPPSPVEAGRSLPDKSVDASVRRQLSVYFPPYAASIGERLQRLAEMQDRSKNYLVVEAILEYLERSDS